VSEYTVADKKEAARMDDAKVETAIRDAVFCSSYDTSKSMASAIRLVLSATCRPGDSRDAGEWTAIVFSGKVSISSLAVYAVTFHVPEIDVSVCCMYHAIYRRR